MWIHLAKSVSSPDTGASPLDCGSPGSLHEPSAMSNGMTTASESSPSASPTDILTTPRSGMTLDSSTGDLGVDEWISSLVASRVSHIQSPDSAAESLTSVTSGQTRLESFGKWDHDSSSLRTSQVCLFPTEGQEVTLQPWLESFPPSGTMLSGTAYRLRPLVPRTSVGGGGVWPTPRNSPAMETTGYTHKLEEAVAKTGMWPTPNQRDYKDSGPNVDWEKVAKKSKLAGAVNVAKPESGGGDLQAAVLWPTPRAQDGKHASPTEWERENRPSNYLLHAQVDGQLNPGFVEWLMGLPQGWTDLAPLTPEAYQRWAQGYHWNDGEWEGVPRVGTGVKDRVNRLKALGNGIVPACVARFLT